MKRVGTDLAVFRKLAKEELIMEYQQGVEAAFIRHRKPSRGLKKALLLFTAVVQRGESESAL